MRPKIPAETVFFRVPRGFGASGVRGCSYTRIAGVSQRRPGAFVVFRFEARDAAGELVTVTNFGALYRDVPVESAQGEGMEDPPSSGVEMKPVGTIPVSPTAA